MGTFRYDSKKLNAKQLKIAYGIDIRSLQEQLKFVEYVLSNPKAYNLSEEKIDELREKKKDIFFLLSDLKTEFDLAGLE
jgi:hypothetical protein